MSQVRVRNVERVVEANVVSNANANCINTSSKVESVIAFSTNTELKTLIQSKSFVKNSDTNFVKSPVELRSSFAKSYTSNLKEIPNNVNSLTKQKAAVITTIMNSNYKIQNEDIVKKGIAEISNAKNQDTFKVAVEKMMNSVQSEHNTVFTQSIASVVKEASVAIGFSNVSLIKNGAKISIVAENPQGEAILTEVRVDKDTSKVNLVSETIGIADNSCNDKLNQLDKEMEKRGLKHKESKVKWTGGKSWLPESKKIEKRIKSKKTKSNKKNLYRKSNSNKLKN